MKTCLLELAGFLPSTNDWFHEPGSPEKTEYKKANQRRYPGEGSEKKAVSTPCATLPE
jgi:hypothetical protein